MERAGWVCPHSKQIGWAGGTQQDDISMRSVILALAVSSSLIACAPPTTSSPAAAPAIAEPWFELVRPNVVVEADPPPPFTYWAPEGSVIRNHGNPGLWVAHLDGRQVIYFGDSCHASQWQHYVGQMLSSLPPAPAGMSIRTYCTTCAKHDDLRVDRINVVFEEATQRITDIACH
jgi:hypothetical protein